MRVTFEQIGSTFTDESTIFHSIHIVENKYTCVLWHHTRPSYTTCLTFDVDIDTFEYSHVTIAIDGGFENNDWGNYISHDKELLYIKLDLPEFLFFFKAVEAYKLLSSSKLNPDATIFRTLL